MAPTIIVGDDENAGDVAAALLAAADNQRQVKVRTDLARPAFDVPDELYKKHVGRRTRSDDEQRINSVAEVPGDDETIEGDELPPAAQNAEPGTGEIAGDIEGDELPDAARNVEPPSNGDQGDGDQGDQGDAEPEAPKPRKRTSTRRATKSTPAAAAGAGE